MSTKQCWKEEKSRSYNGKSYFVNTESGVSQWGQQDPKRPLPAGWEYCISTNSFLFYHNMHNNDAQWDRPTDEDRLPVPEGFEEKRSENCKNVYYVNLETGKTQWEYPEKKEEMSKIKKKLPEKVV